MGVTTPGPVEPSGDPWSRLREQADRLEHGLPAWLRPTRGTPRWPALLAIAGVIALQLAVRRDLVVRPFWVVPAVETALLLVLLVANPGRIDREDRRLRALALALIAVLSLGTLFSAVLLVDRLVHGQLGGGAPRLLANGAAIWATNVIVFALWFWEFDSGGPAARAQARRTHPDFAFPQMQNPELAEPDWEPAFVDYLYLAFTNATAFSPTDAMPMARWAKLTMLAESAVSLAMATLVIARAINILK